MKKKLITYLLTYLLLPISYIYGEGFISNTLVKTQQGYSSIQELKPSNIISSFCFESPFSAITEIITYTTQSFIRITIETTSISCALDQLFYSYNQQAWIKAKDLLTTDVLINDKGNPIAIHSIQLREHPCTLYALSLKPNHTYCVSEHNIVVHNIAHVAIIPLSIASTIIPVAKACFFGAATFLGIHFAKKATHKQYAHENISSVSGNSYYPNPNDPNNNKNKDHPHGIYRDAPYHHKNSRGKSKCPDDGQRCLDYSLPSKTEQRVAIEGNEFVVLRITRPGEYHGFKVPWKKLHESLREILIEHGFVRRSGKIIKLITEKYPT